MENLNIKHIIKDEAVLQRYKQNIEFVRLMSYYKCAVMEIETKLNVLNEEFALRFDRNPICDIRTRIKNPISIFDKLKRRGYSLELPSMEEHLNDIAGIRVICPFTEDVYTVADALLKQDDITLIEKKDYIESPKKNGYRSLHLIVSVPIFLENEKKLMRAEIQLRTIAMDCWATLEHQLNYKKPEGGREIERELFECARLSAELDGRMNSLKRKILDGKDNKNDRSGVT